MFRARFAETLPKSLANFGPQELERDVVDSVPGDRVEHFLCALLGLLLNRKQDVKYGLSLQVQQKHQLTFDFKQSWTLQPCPRGGCLDTQGPVGARLGEQESFGRWSHVHLHEPSSTGMVPLPLIQPCIVANILFLFS